MSAHFYLAGDAEDTPTIWQENIRGVGEAVLRERDVTPEFWSWLMAQGIPTEDELYG